MANYKQQHCDVLDTDLTEAEEGDDSGSIQDTRIMQYAYICLFRLKIIKFSVGYVFLKHTYPCGISRGYLQEANHNSQTGI